MGKLGGLAVAVVLVASTVGAEPISVSEFAHQGGVSLVSSDTSKLNQIDLNLLFTSPGSALVAFNGLKLRTNVLLNVSATNMTQRAWEMMEFELLDPRGDGDDAADPLPYPAYVPAGWSTSNSTDGISFPATLKRSNILKTIVANDQSDAHDIFDFTGAEVKPNQTVRFWIQVRESMHTAPLLLRLTPDPQASVTPEPASMVLLGSGLLMGWAGRRRRVSVE
jgi:hypothetical protein